MNRILLAAIAAVWAGAAAATPLVVEVDVSDQVMVVYQQGEAIHQWPVSTARPGKVTPRGIYAPEWLSRNHRSSLYNGAPMPFSIFYDGNFAIHGTDQVARLGQPASAGCVRLSPDNARVLFEHVSRHGLDSLTIAIRD